MLNIKAPFPKDERLGLLGEMAASDIENEDKIFPISFIFGEQLHCLIAVAE